MSGRYAVRWLWVAFLVLASTAPAAAQADPPVRGLEATIERGMEDWEIPGLAIAVVRGDAVVYARGFGVRELGGRDLVDEHTLFAIGSATKAFTAAGGGGGFKNLRAHPPREGWGWRGGGEKK
jgi:CubicO group peptidase (beta-lactamase class C family)